MHTLRGEQKNCTVTAFTFSSLFWFIFFLAGKLCEANWLACEHRTCFHTTDFYWNIFMKNERDMTHRQALKLWENDCMRRLSKPKHITGIKTIVDANAKCWQSHRSIKKKQTVMANSTGQDVQVILIHNSFSVSTAIFIFLFFF